MNVNEAIRCMTNEIVSILSDNTPTVYLCGSVVLGDFKLGWSDIDILVLTKSEITAEQANTLAGLRQDLLERYPENPYFRLFEGGMLSADAFVSGKKERTVYWGTSGQRVTDGYKMDSFGMAQLLDSGVLLYGEDVRDKIEYPTYAQMRDDAASHAQSARKYGNAVGWLLDVARGVYTLRTGRIIAKTAAGEWALENGLCPDKSAMERAVLVRKEAHLKHDKQIDNAVIQRFADVLEWELYTSDPCGSLSTAFWKKEHFPMPENIEVVREKDLEKYENSEYSRYFKLMRNLKTIGNRKLPNGYCSRHSGL